MDDKAKDECRAQFEKWARGNRSYTFIKLPHGTWNSLAMPAW